MIVCIFLLCMVRYIFFGIKVISRLTSLIYENIANVANKIFNVPNHLKLCNMHAECQFEVMTYISISKPAGHALEASKIQGDFFPGHFFTPKFIQEHKRILQC